MDYRSASEVPSLPVPGELVTYAGGGVKYQLTGVSDTEWRVERGDPFPGVAILSTDARGGWYELNGEGESSSVYGSDGSWRFLLSKLF